MATDSGGKRGPQSTRLNGPDHRNNDRGGGYRNNSNDYDRTDSRDRNDPYRSSQQPQQGQNGIPPPVPGFGFNFTGMPNMPMFPPGFLNAAAGGAGQQGPPGQ